MKIKVLIYFFKQIKNIKRRHSPLYYIVDTHCTVEGHSYFSHVQILLLYREKNVLVCNPINALLYARIEQILCVIPIVKFSFTYHTKYRIFCLFLRFLFFSSVARYV